MKKIPLIFTVLLSILFISCAKIPFTPKQPESNAALVYVYTGEAPADTERTTSYKVHINGKSSKYFLKDNEYLTYDMRAVSIKITGSRNNIERHSLDANLEAGKTYYFKLQSISDGFGKFEFTQVDANKALVELQETTLAGAYDTASSIIDALVTPDENKNEALVKKETAATRMSASELEAMIDKKVAQKTVSNTSTLKTATSSTNSKLDDIKNAYQMKKDGLLSEEEFKAMKAEILAK